MKKLQLKRIYEKSNKDDGYRILVDRLWPRGLKKAEAKIDLWLKEIAPSNELRKWFNHDVNKWKPFCTKYNKELKSKDEELDLITQHLKKSNVTLLFGASDKEHNQAVALLHYIQNS
ncbi:MAG: DUF488 family protein [Gammaproteobacteria bacterium]|nr:MAG: DUF488 family protein [Gammaproteobacteria bacterium]